MGSKSGLSSGFGGTTTFAFGSSDLHRVPDKPFAPAQGLKTLDGTFAREKNARVSDTPNVEYHPRRLKLDHGGISQWDHASPKCRAVLANMTSYDELERRLLYHRKGRVEEPMLRGLLQTYNCTFHLAEQVGGGVSHHYYMVHDERGGVRGFCCLCLENAGVIRGGGSIAGREEMNLLGFYWVDAIEGNEEALQEEREKLRRRKAREERLAAEHIAQMENERLQREAEAHEKLLREREAASRNRREEMRRKVQAVQRKVLTQISARGGSSVHSLGRTFQMMDRDKSYTLDRQELEEGMAKQGLALAVNEIDLLINFYDNDGKGALNYDELVEALKCELSERRWGLIRKAFDMLDSSSTGMVSVETLASAYNAREHPDVKSRRRTEADVLREFLKGFESTRTAGMITFEEFEQFFAYNTAMIDDDYFALMMRQAWGVAE